MKPQDFSAEHETASSEASADFALRILRGWHAGAQIVLQPGETLRVGGGEDCDIVLTDEVVAQSTLQVRLTRADDGRLTGWQLRQQASTAFEPSAAADEGGGNEGGNDGDWNDPATPFDTPVHIGPLTITVSRADASWPAVFLPDAPMPIARDDAPSAPQSLDDARQTTTGAIGNEGDDARQSASRDAEERPTEQDVSTDPSGQGAMDAEDAAKPVGAGAHDASPPPSHDDKTARKPMFAWRERRDKWRTDGAGMPTRWIMAAGVLAMVATMVALIRVLPGPAPVPPSSTPTIAVDSLAETRMALRAGGWIDGIRADVDSAGNVVVSGWVADDAARDRLSAAMARLTPMPAMRIDIVADAVQAGRDTAARFGPFLSVDAGDRGALRIRGVALPPSDPDARVAGANTPLPTADDDDDDPLLPALRAALHAALAAAVPNATLNDAALLTTDGAVRALEDALAQARLPKAAIHWERGNLIGTDAASGAVDRAGASSRFGQLLLDAPAGTDIAQLQRTLDGFRNRYGERIPIRTLIAGSRATFTSAQLPFAIVSISSGPLPSVVVDGNVRLLPGGTYRGFRLVHVDDNAVVFDRAPAAVPGSSPSAVASARIVLQR